MNIWTFVCRYDGELSVSTHLTQKGALLVAVGDVLDYLGIYEGLHRYTDCGRSARGITLTMNLK